MTITGGSVCPLKPLSVPVDICALSLRLHACEATIAQLDDCAETVSNACLRVGHGCAAFRAAANCSETFVQQTSDMRSGCSVRYR
jgi:hypothetical protein